MGPLGRPSATPSDRNPKKRIRVPVTTPKRDAPTLRRRRQRETARAKALYPKLVTMSRILLTHVDATLVVTVIPSSVNPVTLRQVSVAWKAPYRIRGKCPTRTQRRARVFSDPVLRLCEGPETQRFHQPRGWSIEEMMGCVVQLARSVAKHVALPGTRTFEFAGVLPLEDGRVEVQWS